MPPARVVFYLATLGGIVLTARAVLTVPPPLWVSALAAVSYLAIVLAGVLVLRLRMFADALVRGPADARGVALTFDDVDPLAIPAVLDALERARAKATFFVVGEKADAHADAIRAIVERGHAVGVHGWASDRLVALRGPRHVRRDLERAVRSIEKATKVRPALYRPLAGRTNPTIARLADQLELAMVGWSAGARTRKLADGDVVRIDRAGALADVLAAIDAQNLRVVPLEEWIDEEE